MNVILNTESTLAIPKAKRVSSITTETTDTTELNSNNSTLRKEKINKKYNLLEGKSYHSLQY